jgi:hypothetical protein
MMTEIFHLANSEDGLEAIVTELSSEGTTRYRVKFMDTDADQTIAILTLPTKEHAEWYANLINRPE